MIPDEASAAWNSSPPAESIGGVAGRGCHDRGVRGRSLTALPISTVLGCTVPVVGLFVAMLVGARALAVAALVAGLFAPALGHVIYRRVLFTRGLRLRLAVSAVVGLLVVSARQQRELGTSLGLVLVAAAVLLVGFVTGMILDLIDADRAARSYSTASDGR
jgi:hypothetical protein